MRAYVDEARVPLIHVTHHRNEARVLADRVVLIEAGRITASGGVDELVPASRDMLDDSLRIHTGSNFIPLACVLLSRLAR